MPPRAPVRAHELPHARRGMAHGTPGNLKTTAQAHPPSGVSLRPPHTTYTYDCADSLDNMYIVSKVKTELNSVF